MTDVPPRPTLSAGDEEALLEGLRHGMRAADADDPRGAESAFRHVLAASRGGGSRVERLAVGCLVKLFSRHARDVETFVLARRHLALARAGDAEDECFALAGLVASFSELEDWPRFDVWAAKCGEALDAHVGPHAPALRRHLGRMRARRELARGDVEEARSLLAAASAPAVADADAGLEARDQLLLHAEIALRRGRPQEAREALTRAAASPAPMTAQDVDIRRLMLVCEHETAGRDAAVQAARADVEWLETATVLPGAAARLHLATQVGDFVEKTLGEHDLAKRWYDVAAAAALLRAAEIERAVQGLPELAKVEGDDAVALADYRARFVAARGALLDSVAKLLRVKVGLGEAPSWAGAAQGGAVPLCAWCGRVRLPDGTMLPVGQFLPRDDAALRVSHGLCGSCASRVTGLRELPDAPPTD